MRLRSAIRRCSRGRGRSACRSTGVRRATLSSWNTTATPTCSSASGIRPDRLYPRSRDRVEGCEGSGRTWRNERAALGGKSSVASGRGGKVSHRFPGALASLAAALCFLRMAAPAAGQAFYPKDIPKFPQAKTWLLQKAKLPPYTPPRTPDGVPDLQGVWGGPVGGGNDDIEEHEYVDATTPAQESYISDPADGKIPYTPWARAKRDEIRAGLKRGWPGETGERLYVDPNSFCLVGMPRIALGGQEIVQKPGYVVLLGPGSYRVIPTDGRAPLGARPKLWRGISRGRWEGDTLVVEVTGLNARTWIDSVGNFITENTRVIERWRLVDAN